MWRDNRLINKVNIRRIWKESFASAGIILLLPYVITMLYQGKGGIQTAYISQPSENIIKHTNEEESFLVGLLAKTIPVDYPMEALKSQAIVLRTQAAGQTETEIEKGYSVEEMKELWGTQMFQEYYQKLETAVNETSGLVMLYESEIIYAPFHAVSAGATRSAESLMGEGKYPYLNSVDCCSDVEAIGFLAISYESPEDIYQKLTQKYSISCDPQAIMEHIRIVRADETGYVEIMEIDGRETTGEEVRRLLGLASASFQLGQYGDQIRIVTKGLGHGLGLDQYQAKKMAEEGRNSNEILCYFFSGITIEEKHDLFMKAE